MSGAIDSIGSLKQTISRCLDRDADWKEYHAGLLADLTEEILAGSSAAIRLASLERKAFRLWRDQHHEKAINVLTEWAEQTQGVDEQTKSWCLELSGRVAHSAGDETLAQTLQKRAYGHNHGVLRPTAPVPYKPIAAPSKQSEMIASGIGKYHLRRGFLKRFEQAVAALVPTSTSGQFEQALADLGSFLGFSTQRPERLTGPGPDGSKKGPDVLWLLDDTLALAVEAKSRKDGKNPLTKKEFGQLLAAGAWLRVAYPNHRCVLVSVHPNDRVTRETTPLPETMVLTLDKLRQLITDTRSLLTELCESQLEGAALVMRCEESLSRTRLRPADLVAEYLAALKPQSA